MVSTHVELDVAPSPAAVAVLVQDDALSYVAAHVELDAAASPAAVAVLVQDDVLSTTLAELELAAAASGAVPFCCMAICLKVSWDFSAVGLIEKTIPLPQCEPVFCLQ